MLVLDEGIVSFNAASYGEFDAVGGIAEFELLKERAYTVC